MVKNPKKSFLETAWEVAQTVGLGAGILAIKGSVEAAIAEAGKKAGEKIGKKVGDTLGLSSEEAAKNDDDEISLRKVYLKGNLKEDEIEKFKNWLGELRKRDEKLANEVTKRIHNAIVKSSKETSKIIKVGGNPKKTTSKDEADGIAIAVDIIRDILKALAKSEATCQEVLDRENIKVPAKKPPAPFIKKTADYIESKKEKIVTEQAANFTDLKSFAQQAEEKAKERFKKTFKGRK